MIILGDIASPDRITTGQLEKIFREYGVIFRGKSVIFNLEGLLSQQTAKYKLPVLWNHTTLPSALKKTIIPVLCLANNHTLDLPNEYDNTISILQREGIAFSGAGRSIDEALRPVFFYEGEQQIILLNACWDFLLYNHKNPSSGIYVAELDEFRLIKEVSEYKHKNQNVKIVVYLHWSLDLETLPFPMYRNFSHDLIDSGANVVVGCHSHCIQGGEKYMDGFIIYGLGNFFIPQKYFINSKLVYPDFASLEMAFEWNPSSNLATCHWFNYLNNDIEHKLVLLGSDIFEDSEMLSRYSPYQGMSDKEYTLFFRKNRRKKILIPIYKSYKRRHFNKCLTGFLKFRARFARFLAKIGFRKWLN